MPVLVSMHKSMHKSVYMSEHEPITMSLQMAIRMFRQMSTHGSLHRWSVVSTYVEYHAKTAKMNLVVQCWASSLYLQANAH